MNVLLGVTGGIAAYKACALVRALKKRGDDVRVVMTRGAQEFVTPMTLQILSENTVGTTLFDPTYESEIGHIDLARWPDVILVAPATANVIAKMAHGMADDLLTTVLLATTAPVVVAPAMNTQMYAHPSVARNLETLQREYGYHVVSPDSGELACKEVGKGRLPDPEVLLAAVDRACSPNLLSGVHVLITAGPTREHIDPARFISNPSSGKMGYALAAAAIALGANVTLVTGPVQLDPPPGLHRLVRVMTAKQMFDAVTQAAPTQRVIIKVAAVCDWRPRDASEKKRAKSQMSSSLELERNPDILATLGELYGPERHASRAPGDDALPLIVGFAAESHDIQQRGRAKLARKRAHALVANQIGGAHNAFGADASRVWLIHHDQDAHPEREIGPAPKTEIAHALWLALLDFFPLN